MVLLFLNSDIADDKSFLLTRLNISEITNFIFKGTFGSLGV